MMMRLIKYFLQKKPVTVLLLLLVLLGGWLAYMKMGKLEDQRFKIWIQSVGFVLFAFYLRTLKDNIAYIFVSITAICYLAYQYYMLSLDRATE